MDGIIKVMYYGEKEEGELIGELLTNHSMTDEEIINLACGYNFDDPEECEQAHKDGFPAVYQSDDSDEWQLDFEYIKFIYT